LGFAGFLSVIAVIAYFICQNLICCAPRPQPIFNLCKKKTPRRKKKKKKTNNPNEEDRGLTGNDDNEMEDGFHDEPNGYVDPYDESYAAPDSHYDDEYDYGNDYDRSYANYDTVDNDGYNDGENTYAEGHGESTYGESVYTDGDDDDDVRRDDYGDYDDNESYSQSRKHIR
jgi:hypothetical protein